MAAPHLPLDIVETIIDLLAAEVDDSYYLLADYTHLKACSLASKLFLPITRRHIFSTLTFLSFPHPGAQRDHLPKAFNNLLDRTPDITSCVRTLSYSILESDFVDTEVQRLLGRLPELRVFNLLHAGGSHNTWAWSSIPLDHMSILYGIMQLPTLTSLGLTAFSKFPASILASMTQLENFYMDHMEFKPVEALCPLQSTSRTTSRLHSLDVGGGNAVSINTLLFEAQGFHPAFNIKGLQELCAHLECDADTGSINKVITATSETLTSLDIEGKLAYIYLGNNQPETRPPRDNISTSRSPPSCSAKFKIARTRNGCIRPLRRFSSWFRRPLEPRKSPFSTS